MFLEQINVTNGGKNLIEDSELMLAHGRRYGLVGRNGTGKSTFLRALVSGEIKGLPKHAQVLHVEQEVVGDDTTVLQVRFRSLCCLSQPPCLGVVEGRSKLFSPPVAK